MSSVVFKFKSKLKKNIKKFIVKIQAIFFLVNIKLKVVKYFSRYLLIDCVFNILKVLIKVKTKEKLQQLGFF